MIVTLEICTFSPLNSDLTASIKARLESYLHAAYISLPMPHTLHPIDYKDGLLEKEVEFVQICARKGCMSVKLDEGFVSKLI